MIIEKEEVDTMLTFVNDNGVGFSNFKLIGENIEFDYYGQHYIRKEQPYGNNWKFTLNGVKYVYKYVYDMGRIEQGIKECKERIKQIEKDIQWNVMYGNKHRDMSRFYDKIISLEREIKQWENIKANRFVVIIEVAE